MEQKSLTGETFENILSEEQMSQNPHVPLEVALRASEAFADEMRRLGFRRGIDFEICGSIRRQRPTCGDIDVVVSSESFTFKQGEVEGLLTDTFVAKKSGILKSGMFHDMKVEFYVGPAARFGALLLFATGSPGFNIRCRQNAKQRGWKLSQYGVFDGEGSLVRGCIAESIILDALDMSRYLDPVSREM